MTTIKLPIIEYNKSVIRTIYLTVFSITMLGFFVLMITLKDDNHLIGKLFLITILLFIIGMFFIKNPGSQNGYLTINKNEIVYSASEKTEIFTVSEISQIEFKYDGYSGKPKSLNVLYASSGRDNMLKFKHNGSDKIFYIQLEFNYLRLLRRVLKEFAAAGVPISVINSRGRKIEL